MFKFFSKKKKETLDSGLEKTQTGMWNKISHAIAGKARSTTKFSTISRKHSS